MVKQGDVPPPPEVLTGLKRWLTAAFGWGPISEGNVLVRPHQTDSVSCSICSLNTIAHNVFGDKIWKQCDAPVLQASWLLKFAHYKRLKDPNKPVGVPECSLTLRNVPMTCF